MCSVENPPTPPSVAVADPHTSSSPNSSSSSSSSTSCSSSLKNTDPVAPPHIPLSFAPVALSDASTHDGLPSHDTTAAPSLQSLKNTSFSIRGYVCAVRSNDISTSWPFSAKHLQLCLKNGVKDPLPPFQHLPSFGGSCALTSCAVQPAEKLAYTTGKDPFVQEDQSASGSLIDSGRDYFLEEALGFPDGDPLSLTKEGNNLETERTASPCKPPPSAVADGIEVAAPPAAAIPTPSNRKRCRLVLKLGRNRNHKSSTEDVTCISEGLMASKICPVCQTFSSSSNTTLNAHIDHCLFAKPPSPQPGNNELSRPRIKPRKIRLMSDIYESALRCTLEGLDRRNGTHWADEMNLQLQATNSARDNGKNLVSSSGYPLDHTKDESVYIDANGKKIRILSVPSDASLRFRTKNRLKERKPHDRRGGDRIFSSKKKKYLGTHLKHLKLTPCTSTVLKDFPPKGMVLQKGHPRDKQKVPVLEDRKRKKPSIFKMLAKTVLSKSSGFPNNKSPNKSNHQHDKCIRASKDVLDRSEQLYFDGSGVSSSHVGGNSSSQARPNVPAKIDTGYVSSHEAETADECYADGRKRPSNLILRLPNHANVELLRKLSYAVGSSDRSGGDNFMPEGVVGIPVGAAEAENWFSSCSRSSSGSFYAFSSMGMSLPSCSSKNGYLLDQSTVPAFQFSAKQKDFALGACPHNEIAGNLAGWPSKTSQRLDAVDNIFDCPSASEIVECLGGRRSRKRRPKRACLASDPTVYEVPQRDFSSCYPRDEVDNFSFYGGLSHDIDGHLSCIMKKPNGGEVAAADISSKGAQSLHQSSVLTNDVDEENQVRMFCSGEPIPISELRSGVKHGMLTGDGICGGDVTGDEDRVACCCKLGGEDSVVAYDPIPIPGPPGSYLPSPRDMDSEVFHGNSSLTTSCMQFSPDPSDAADEGSLDSPISALSTISNFIEPKASYRNSSQHVGPHSLLSKGWSEFSNGRSSQVVTQKVASISGTDAILDVDISRGGLMSREERTLRLRSGGHPCSCSRKEGIPWDAAGDVEGLQPPIRHSVRLVDVASTAKKMGWKLETTPSVREMLMAGSNPADCLQRSTSWLAQSPSKQAGEPTLAPAPVDTKAKACTDGCASPSTLVLRLMGKNLMVGNSSESPQAFDGQP